MGEIRECPFCQASDTRFSYLEEAQICKKCDARGPFAQKPGRAVKEWSHRPTEDALRSERDALRAENERLRDALDSVLIYGGDTLSGRIDGPSDIGWYRDGIREMRNCASAALSTKGGEDA